MAYLDEGQGPPVLMVHGNPTWSFYYRRLTRALGSSHRCIVPDHIGCGRSDKPHDEHYSYTLQQRIDDLEGLIDALDLPPVTLVVHDWGGAIGMGWAVRHPERVARIVVLNTAAFGLPSDKRFPPALTLARTPVVGAMLVRGLNAFVEGTLRFGVRKPLAPAVAQGYRAPYGSWAHRIAVHRFIQDIPLHPHDRSAPALDAVARGLAVLADKPMLIAWGRRDFVFDDAFLREWTRRFPDAAVHVFEDAGHLVLEDAADEIIELVRAFLLPSP